MKLQGIFIHFGRLRYQLGRKLRLGANKYKLSGYCANRFSTDTEHEPHIYLALERLLAARDGAFIDIGVNTGQTFLKLLSIDPVRPYIGFEPQLECAFYVNKFIGDNELTHAQILPIALSNADSFLPLYFNAVCDSMASLENDTEVDGSKRFMRSMVSVRKGDSVFKELKPDSVSIIKIDVEGAELSVLEGLTETLAEFKPIVLFELLPNFYGQERVMKPKENCNTQNDIANQLYRFFDFQGYRIFQLDKHGHEHEITHFDLDNPEKFVSSDYIAHPVK